MNTDRHAILPLTFLLLLAASACGGTEMPGPTAEGQNGIFTCNGTCACIAGGNCTITCAGVNACSVSVLDHATATIKVAVGAAEIECGASANCTVTGGVGASTTTCNASSSCTANCTTGHCGLSCTDVADCKMNQHGAGTVDCSGCN